MCLLYAPKCRSHALVGSLDSRLKNWDRGRDSAILFIFEYIFIEEAKRGKILPFYCNSLILMAWDPPLKNSNVPHIQPFNDFLLQWQKHQIAFSYSTSQLSFPPLQIEQQQINHSVVNKWWPSNSSIPSLQVPNRWVLLLSLHRPTLKGPLAQTIGLHTIYQG